MIKLTPSLGLKLEPDSTPTSGSMVEDAEIIDETLYTSATGLYWWNGYSYGLDLGTVQVVASLICRCALAAYTPESWYGSSYDSVMVYKSDDGSSWTAVEQFDAPPFVHAASGQLAFMLEFSVEQTARYFKVQAIATSTLAINPGGSSLQVSEVEAYSTEDGSLILPSMLLVF